MKNLLLISLCIIPLLSFGRCKYSNYTYLPIKMYYVDTIIRKNNFKLFFNAYDDNYGKCYFVGTPQADAVRHWEHKIYQESDLIKNGIQIIFAGVLFKENSNLDISEFYMLVKNDFYIHDSIDITNFKKKIVDSLNYQRKFRHKSYKDVLAVINKECQKRWEQYDNKGNFIKYGWKRDKQGRIIF